MRFQSALKHARAGTCEKGTTTMSPRVYLSCCFYAFAWEEEDRAPRVRVFSNIDIEVKIKDAERVEFFGFGEKYK